MTIDNIKTKIFNDKDYDFLRENPHLGNNITLIGLGGSYAYGTNNENSDIDVRGIALNSPEEILTGTDFEQVVETNTDTTIYSVNKMLTLLSSGNPNTIEILGLKKDHYLKVSDIGQYILDNKDAFLSKHIVQTFCGYAYSQLRRLDNKSVRKLSQAEKEQHILHSIDNMMYSIKERYAEYSPDNIKMYLDDADNPELDKEIFIDINLRHYPARDYASILSEINNVIREYTKLGKRNQNAIEHGKLGKHMMHLLRLYMTGIDILEKKEIITYREDEHDLLMSIRNGEFMNKDGLFIPEFFELVNDLEIQFQYAAENTDLPDLPDMKKIEDFKANINEKIVKGEFNKEVFKFAALR